MHTHPAADSVAIVAVIPLKAIADAKTRMAPSLSPSDRSLLLRRTFGRVMAAVRGAATVGRTLVVAGDVQGQSWAREEGAEVMPEPTDCRGLNDALMAADALLGDVATLVLPADLPLVTSEDVYRLVGALDDVEHGDSSDHRGVAIAPTADGGTGGLFRVPGGVIVPRFGPDSAVAHATAARAAGLRVATVHVPGMALDLDRPSDIRRAGGWRAVTAAVGDGPDPQGYPAR